MKIGGIIAEYNPFHKGHSYQIEEFKKKSSLSHIVVAMSGNFVQRGGPALIDKYARTQMALHNGVDLVIEIPSIFAGQTAEIFARGGLLSLNSLGCVDSFCFGSEDGDIDKLSKLADFMFNESTWIQDRSRLLMKEGLSYSRARQEAISNAFKDFNVDSLLGGSNNILALEYLKEARRLKTSMEPMTIKREGSSYNSLDIYDEIPSASAIRQVILNAQSDKTPCENKELDQPVKEVLRQAMDNTSLELLDNIVSQGIDLMGEESFFQEISYIVAREGHSIKEYFEVNDGLENSIQSQVAKSISLEDSLGKLSNKSHTRSKVRRALYNILLGISWSDVDQAKLMYRLPYIRVLGMNDRGRDILRLTKEKSDLDIITSPAKAKASGKYTQDSLYRLLLNTDLRTSAIYYQKYYYKSPKILARGQADFFDTRYNL